MEGPANLLDLTAARRHIDTLPTNLFSILWEVYAKMYGVHLPVLSATERGSLRVLAAMVERQEREGWQTEAVRWPSERGR